MPPIQEMLNLQGPGLQITIEGDHIDKLRHLICHVKLPVANIFLSSFSPLSLAIQAFNPIFLFIS